MRQPELGELGRDVSDALPPSLAARSAPRYSSVILVLYLMLLQVKRTGMLMITVHLTVIISHELSLPHRKMVIY